MGTHDFTLKLRDGLDLYIHSWLPEGAARGVLLISHGMVEHAGRYERLARRLLAEGWAVYGPDHRGHGKSAPADGLGYPGRGKTFSDIVEDLYEVSREASARHPGLPLALFGHSFGALVAEAFLARHGSDCAACVLTGLPTQPPASLDISGGIVIGLASLLRGERAPAYLPKKLTFGQYNKAFAPNRTPADWVSRDEKEVDAYLSDRFSSFTASYAFYRELRALVRHLYVEGAVDRLPSGLALGVFAGEADQVIGSPEALRKLAARIRGRGVAVDLRFYPGARHELVNETNRDEVLDDIAGWLAARLPKA